MTQPIQIGDKAQQPRALLPGGFALWNLGFRPLYLGAGIFSAFSIAWWIAQFSGAIQGSNYLRDSLWHAHEMIFGYAFAVVVGFLFTAVRNWTRQPTPKGRPLAVIVSLWLAARLLLIADLAPLSALADVAFAGAAAWGIGVPLLKSGSRSNYFFVPLLLAIGLVNLVFHLAASGQITLPLPHLLQVALDLVMFIMAVVAGRVIPMFTATALPRTKPRKPEWLERLALGSVLALLAADAMGLPPLALALCAGAAALAHGARLALWQPWQTWQRPILWILHAAYAWIVAHLALRAIAYWDVGSLSLANHALTVGAIGGLTMGMMTRTARGHTGRPLMVGKAEIAAYVLVQLAAVVRVLGPLCFPALTLASIVGAGLLWVIAFLLFAVTYAPILWRPRVDGQPG